MVGGRDPPTQQGAPLTGGTAKPPPATERGRRARADIADAAVLVYQRGVRATSLDDVLAAAGCGKSQLYHYFDDKADLVGAVVDRQLEFVLADLNSTQAFCHGEPGSMKSEPAPLNRHQSLTACATNSGPLSKRT